MCAPPTGLQPNDSQSGSIANSSCLLSDGTSYQAYSVILPTRGNLQLSLKGTSGFAPTLILRDSFGHQSVTGTSITHYSEAGTYTVLVDAPKAKQTGSYSLTSVFTPEANTFCSRFPTLGPNQTVTRALSTASCKLPDQSAYDGYSITVFGSGILTITMTAAAFDSYVILRGDNGSQLGEARAGGSGNPANITLPVDGNGTYTIVAAAASSTEKPGQYQLATTFTPNPDETCVPQGALDQNPQISGSVGVTSCNFNLPNRQDSSLFNFYTLHVGQAGLAQITVPDSSFSPLLLLLDANGNQIAEDAQSGGGNTPLVVQPLSPGDYVLIIFNQDSFEGNYDLQYTLTPAATPMCVPMALTGSTPTVGTLDSLTSCRSSGFLVSRYQIVLPVAGLVDIDLSSQDFTSLLFMEDAKNSQLYFGEETTDGGAHIQANLAAGTYYAVAASADLPGGYTINYAVKPGPIPACPAAKSIPVANGGSNGYNGTLGGPASCYGVAGALLDNYTFTIPSSGTVAALMLSSDVDSVLVLTDSKGNPLRTDNNSYSQGNAIIVDYLAAGTYRLQTMAGGFQNTGNYQVDLLFTAATTSPRWCAPKSATKGTPVKATLSYTSCQYPDDTFADFYRISVTDATNPIDISAVSTNFDTYLILLDAKGNVVATDDNSGGATDAHLIQNITPGTYFVIVKPAGDPSSSGSYTLTIQ